MKKKKYSYLCTDANRQNKTIMKHPTLILKWLMLMALVMTAIACSQPASSVSTQTAAEAYVEDSTIYGLACDGCNDTIVVFLRIPYDGGDPDTLNILEASRRHQVFGTPLIGSKLAMMLNSTQTDVADMVIVTENLLGLWCYKMHPTLRQRADMEGQSEGQSLQQLPDTIRELLEQEFEYGINIKPDSVAFPHATHHGGYTSDENSLVEYHKAKRYTQWFIRDGKLILNESAIDSLGNSFISSTDTAMFVRLDADTLILRFADGEHNYYRKKDTEG